MLNKFDDDLLQIETPCQYNLYSMWLMLLSVVFVMLIGLSIGIQ